MSQYVQEAALYKIVTDTARASSGASPRLDLIRQEARMRGRLKSNRRRGELPLKPKAQRWEGVGAVCLPDRAAPEVTEEAMNRRSTAAQQRKRRVEAMVRAFFAAGPWGLRSVAGESTQTLIDSMMLAVTRQFPETDAADRKALVRVLRRTKLPGPSGEQLRRAIIGTLAVEMITEVLERKVHDGEMAREIAPVSDEVTYLDVPKK